VQTFKQAEASSNNNKSLDKKLLKKEIENEDP
jgi:hypothetical protein